MTKTTIDVLGREDTIKLISKEWMLVTAGTSESFNTMTANWGGIGSFGTSLWHSCSSVRNVTRMNSSRRMSV